MGEALKNGGEGVSDGGAAETLREMPDFDPKVAEMNRQERAAEFKQQQLERRNLEKTAEGLENDRNRAKSWGESEIKDGALDRYEGQAPDYSKAAKIREELNNIYEQIDEKNEVSSKKPQEVRQKEPKEESTFAEKKGFFERMRENRAQRKEAGDRVLKEQQAKQVEQDMTQKEKEEKRKNELFQKAKEEAALDKGMSAIDRKVFLEKQMRTIEKRNGTVPYELESEVNKLNNDRMYREKYVLQLANNYYQIQDMMRGASREEKKFVAKQLKESGFSGKELPSSWKNNEFLQKVGAEKLTDIRFSLERMREGKEQ